MENEDDKLGPKGPVGTPGDRGKPVCETKPAADETKPAEVKENASDVKGRRDWVKEAYECFIKNAVDLEPTDPAGAVWEYFKKNATDELKAKVKAEGKTAEGCWKFIEAVARKALGGRSGHIDPVTVYAIAMHYFQDVPALPKWEPALEKAEEKRLNKEKIPQAGSVAHQLELKEKLKAEKAKLKGQKPKNGGKEQGFFFDLLETETASPAVEGGVAC